MKAFILKEVNDKRVSITPPVAAKLIREGLSVSVEKGAGLEAGFSDEAYSNAGVTIAERSAAKEADIIFGISRAEHNLMKEGAIFIAKLDALTHKDEMLDFAKSKITAFALELIPRISRAQSMDILSSQANLAGYKAVVNASSAINKVMPLMMTAAGTVTAARTLILGAGVAGLQAIATAKRLGSQVYAFDVRAAVKEQVESLGAKFVEVKSESDAEAVSGYAQQMDEDYQKRQEAAIAEQIEKSDVVITTAMIPGKKAPILIQDYMVKKMKKGAIIIDLAAETGGNCVFTKYGENVDVDGVKVCCGAGLAAELSNDASTLFANNILNFIKLFIKEGVINLDMEEEIIKATCVTHAGAIVNEKLKEV